VGPLSTWGDAAAKESLERDESDGAPKRPSMFRNGERRQYCGYSDGTSPFHGGWLGTWSRISNRRTEADAVPVKAVRKPRHFREGRKSVSKSLTNIDTPQWMLDLFKAIDELNFAADGGFSIFADDVVSRKVWSVPMAAFSASRPFDASKVSSC